METLRLELEMEARRLNTALQESGSRAEALEAEKAQMTDRLNSMLATAESEKAQPSCVQSAGRVRTTASGSLFTQPSQAAV